MEKIDRSVCEKGMPEGIMGMCLFFFFLTAARPAMMYASGTCAMGKKDEVVVTDMIMLRWMLG